MLATPKRVTAVSALKAVTTLAAAGAVLALGTLTTPALAGITSRTGPDGASRTAPARTAPVRTAPAVSHARKGAGVWSFSGVHRALIKSGVSWYYTWGPDHPGIASPRGVSFVPMIWGSGSVTTATLRQVKHEGRYLLGFNEPDNAGQANMTVSQALKLWPRLMSTGMRLGSPAVATGAATRGGWLDRFMRGVAARHDRVSFITVHWYGGDFVTSRAVAELKSYLKAIHARYHRPLWLTEFALIRFGAQTTFPSARQQAAFVTAATSMLRGLSYVQRYAWFALPATSGDGTAGLFHPGAVATRAGRAFEAVHA
jgi:hypothetical protein